MKNNTGLVWVIAEQIDCRIPGITFQLLGQARKLADELKTIVEAVLLGDKMKDQPRQLIAAGADRVYFGNAPGFEVYQSEIYTKVIVDLARQQCPKIMLIGSTSVGRELAPLVAACLKTGLTAHCIDLVINENGLLDAKIPAYGGLISIICPEKRPQMATVAGGVFENPDPDENRTGEITILAAPHLNSFRVQTLETVTEDPKGVSLESAPIVVACGAGAGDLEGWCKIAGLAKVLNAALGCTRPAVDEGWGNLETMIGQSGKMINPELYIGVGLSGELQHMVGIVGAKVMVAVNNDPGSPVFEQVDYGIVDDCREFVPLLIEKIKEHLEKRVTC